MNENMIFLLILGGNEQNVLTSGYVEDEVVALIHSDEDADSYLFSGTNVESIRCYKHLKLGFNL